MRNEDKDICCSFCGKTQDEVTRLIEGPDVYICDNCIIKINSKFVNSNYYFTKDFIFFYFSCKKLKNNKKILFEYLTDIKTDFIQKYKEALIDNFSRAYKLIQAIEKSTEMGVEIEKENNVNIHLVEHLVDYIKKISQSFTDLYTQFAFTEDDFLFYSK